MTSDAGEVGERRWGDFYSDGVGHWARDGGHPILTDAEVLRAVLYEDCKGGCDQGKVPLKGGTQGDCLVCGGSGRVLREGVRLFQSPSADSVLVIPLSMLEADDE